MKKLRMKLADRYMEIQEYFNEAFDFLKYFFKKEKKWVFSITILNILSELTKLFSQRNTDSLAYLSRMIDIIASFLSFFVIKKIMETIEEKTEISYGRMWQKSILYSFVIFFVLIPIGIFLLFLWTLGDEILIKIIISSIIMVISLAIVLYFTLYLTTLYMTRDIDLLDAFRYNLHLSKGNRLRIFIPFFMLAVIFYSILAVSYLMKVLIKASFPEMNIIMSMILLISGIIIGLFLSFSTLYSSILSIIIYLNVEYMDLNMKEKMEQEESGMPDNKLLSRYAEEDSNLNFRRGKEEDADKITEILEKAKIELRNLGINQWQKGYPDKADVQEDIYNGNSYVIEKNDEIIATAALIFGKEVSYEKIIEGEWLTNGDYGVIHRIAVDIDLKDRGYSSELLKKLERIVIEKGISAVRVDTHENNKPMQKFLEKNGYVYCGIVYLDKEPESGEKRMAFEKILN